MGTWARSTLTDDDGSGTTGSIWNNSELQKIYDNGDAETKSATYPLAQTKTVIDIVMAAQFGGSATTGVGGSLASLPFGNPIFISRWRDVVRL